MGLLVNIDNGGSFTDAIATDGDRVLHVKAPTTPHDLTQCFVAVLERLALACYGEPDLARLLGDTEHLRYSTTSGTNAVVEHKGSPVGVMVLAGEEETLYGSATSLSASTLWRAMVPQPVVGLDFSGGGLDASRLMAGVNGLISHGVARIVVALPDPRQEALVKDEVLERYPRHLLGAIPVLFSCELIRDPDHGRRLFSAVVNSYLHPGMELFLYGAERVTRQHHLRRPLLIYRNDGDSARVAKTTAIKTYGSGPRGGMAGAEAYARWYRSPLLVAMDIGGTTTDISTVVDGVATQLGHGLVGDEEIPSSFPMGDIVSIGKSTPLQEVRKTLPAEKLLAGNPHIVNQLFFRDVPGDFTCGIWECTPGSFKAKYEEDEFYYMLEGKVVIRDDTGGAVTYLPGDVIVVPAGFVGSWDVVEYTRKIYAHSRPRVPADAAER